MISAYLNQTVVWRRQVGIDAYGRPEWETKTIPARWEGKRQLVRNVEGREVVSEARMFCLAPVQPGDELEYEGRTWTAIAVATIPRLDGSESHREVAV